MDFIAAISLHPGSLAAWVVVGLLAGAIAGRIARGRGYGCLGDLVLGLVGALVGGFIVNLFVSSDVTTNFLETTAVAIVGALLLIYLFRAVRGTL